MQSDYLILIQSSYRHRSSGCVLSVLIYSNDQQSPTEHPSHSEKWANE